MSLEEFSVRWRRAVVTGAGKDIDRSICLALAEADADVLAFSHNADDLATLRDEIYALGGTVSSSSATCPTPTMSGAAQVQTRL